MLALAVFFLCWGVGLHTASGGVTATETVTFGRETVTVDRETVEAVRRAYVGVRDNSTAAAELALVTWSEGERERRREYWVMRCERKTFASVRDDFFPSFVRTLAYSLPFYRSFSPTPALWKRSWKVLFLIPEHTL